MEKSTLRKQAIVNRRIFVQSLSDQDKVAINTLLLQNWQDVLKKTPLLGKHVAGFWPKRDEIDPHPLLKACIQAGAHLCLPVVIDEQTLKFYPYRVGAPLQEGSFGILEPKVQESEVLPDVVIVPLVAFDKEGHRLGYGKGYYDRALKNLRARKEILAVGVGYDCQEVEKIPTHEGDQQLNWVITDKQKIQVNLA